MKAFKITDKDIQSIAEAHAQHAINRKGETVGASDSYVIVMALDFLIIGFSQELKKEILNRSRNIILSEKR